MRPRARRGGRGGGGPAARAGRHPPCGASGLVCGRWEGPQLGCWGGQGGGGTRGLRPGLFQCWENFVGQELYRLMVLDFIFILLDTLFGELVWR